MSQRIIYDMIKHELGGAAHVKDIIDVCRKLYPHLYYDQRLSLYLRTLYRRGYLSWTNKDQIYRIKEPFPEVTIYEGPITEEDIIQDA